MSVLSSGNGLNITAWSYLDNFTIGLVSCPEIEPDLWALADAIGHEVTRLKACLDERSCPAEEIGA